MNNVTIINYSSESNQIKTFADFQHNKTIKSLQKIQFLIKELQKIQNKIEIKAEEKMKTFMDKSFH